MGYMSELRLNIPTIASSPASFVFPPPIDIFTMVIFRVRLTKHYSAELK